MSSTASGHSRNASIASSLATAPSLEEFSLLKAQGAILKKALLEEQTNSKALAAQLKGKELKLREALQQLDLQIYHNESLTKRIDSMREEMKTKSSKSKRPMSTDLNAAILSAELESKILDNERLHEQLSDSLSDISLLREKVNEFAVRNNQLQDQHSRLKIENHQLSSELTKTRVSLQGQMAESRVKESLLQDSLHEITQSLKRVSSRITLEGVSAEDFRSNQALKSSLLGWIKALKDYSSAFFQIIGTRLSLLGKTDIDSLISQWPQPAELRRVLAIIGGWLDQQADMLSQDSSASIPGESRWNEIIAEDLARISNSMNDFQGWYSRLMDCEESSFEEVMCNARLNLLANEILSVKQDLLRHWTLKLKPLPTSSATDLLIASLGGSIIDPSLLDDFLTPVYQQALLKMATINSRMASLTALQNRVARAWASKHKAIPENAYESGDIPPSVKRPSYQNGNNGLPVNPITAERYIQTESSPEILHNSAQTEANSSRSVEVSTDEHLVSESGVQTEVPESLSDTRTQTVLTQNTVLEDASSQTDVSFKEIQLSSVGPMARESVNPACLTNEKANVETQAEYQSADAFIQAETESADAFMQTDAGETSGKSKSADALIQTEAAGELSVSNAFIQTEFVEHMPVANNDVIRNVDQAGIPVGNNEGERDAHVADSIDNNVSAIPSFVEVRTRISTIRKANGELLLPLINGCPDTKDDVITIRRNVDGKLWDPQQVSALLERLELAEAKAIRFERLLASLP